MARTRRQRLGQHFLRDQRVAEAIVAALPADPPRVVEIGPGRGELTAKLLQRFPRIVAIELDAKLASELKLRLGNPEGLEVIGGDALEVDLTSLAAQGPWTVVGNLPYSVATAILRRWLGFGNVFPSLVVMVQREVAQRILAPPGDGERGALSVEFQLLAQGELLFTVPPRCFAPPPKVWSAVLRLRPRGQLTDAVVRRAIRLARLAFTHRRKKLTNALARTVANLGTYLLQAGVSGEARPQELTVDQWLALGQLWEEGG